MSRYIRFVIENVAPVRIAMMRQVSMDRRIH